MNMKFTLTNKISNNYNVLQGNLKNNRQNIKKNKKDDKVYNYKCKKREDKACLIVTIDKL